MTKDISIRKAGATAAYDFRKVDPNENPPVLLHVEWEDHASTSAWKIIPEHIAIGVDPPVVQSVGYRLYEDKRVLILAPSISPQGSNAFSVLTVLKSDIVSRTELTKKRKR